MKIFFVWLLVMHDTGGAHNVVGFVHESDCIPQAAALNAKVGDHRGMYWTCDKQGVEK